MVQILSACNRYIEQAVPRARNSAQRLRALVLVLRYTGMRIGDAVKLSTDQINGNKIFLYAQKSGVPVYTVVPAFVIQAIDIIPRVTARHLFWTGAGKLDGVVSSWRKRLTILFSLAKVSGGHAHRFRDTFATELLLGGVPMERVAILLGHQSIKVTEKVLFCLDRLSASSGSGRFAAGLGTRSDCAPRDEGYARGTRKTRGR
jgi:integrase